MLFPRLGRPVTTWAGWSGWPRQPRPIRGREAAPDGNPWPLVSVVTPSLNQAGFLEEAILSVAHQDYPAAEHIVIDGGSTDGTVELLHRSPQVVWASEPDRGQSAAVNKGLSRAKGEIIGWLNSDDLYEPNAFRTAAAYLAANPDVDVLYGDCYFVYEDGAEPEVRLASARPFDLDFLLNVGCFIHQPAAFFRRRVLECGLLDERLHYAMDFEYWVRLARSGRRFAYLPTPLASFRVHGGSKSGAVLDRFWPEVRRVSRANGGRLLSRWYARHLKERISVHFPGAYRAAKRMYRRFRPLEAD